jgi:hypothetical protein
MTRHARERGGVVEWCRPLFCPAGGAGYIGNGGDVFIVDQLHACQWRVWQGLKSGSWVLLAV